MLVLTRKRLEQIRIGSEIRVTVVKVDRNSVRLGIEAPADVTVLRAELLRNETDDARSDGAIVRLARSNELGEPPVRD